RHRRRASPAGASAALRSGWPSEWSVTTTNLFLGWPEASVVNTSPTPSTGSIRPGAACLSKSGSRGRRHSPTPSTSGPTGWTASECEEPADFMHLMLTLRESKASRYTERDTPIFVGQHVAIREALDALDGAASRVTTP